MIDPTEDLRQQVADLRAALARAQARHTADFHASERYIAERDSARAECDAWREAASYWMGEADIANRLIADLSALRQGLEGHPPGVTVLGEYRRRKLGAVELPFRGPIL